MSEEGFTIALIGCNGRMGAMLRNRWQQAGFTVTGVDRERNAHGELALDPDDVARAVSGSRVVALAVPAPTLPGVMTLLQPCLEDRQLLTDVCSVKILPMRWMQEAFSGPVVGAHPFFGPDNSRDDQRVALVRGERASEAHLRIMERLFQRIGCSTFTTTAEEHDRASAVSQSLHFALSAAYFSLASRQKNLAPYITPSFNRYKEAARKELTVNAAMFCEFTETNPAFRDVLEEVRGILRDAGEGGLRALATEAGKWYAAHPPDDSE